MKNFLLVSWLLISASCISTAHAGEFKLGGPTSVGGANLYVCEVGIHKTCEGCNQHYFEINGITSSSFMLFDSKNIPTSAQVYLNDLYFGSEFYVKYCIDVEGDPTLGSTINAQLFPSVTIFTGAYGGIGANDYASLSKLGATVFEDCTTNAVQPGNPTQGMPVLAPAFTEGSTLANPLSLPDPLELCGSGGCLKRTCVYTILFNETATCYRPIKCVEGVCKPYESTIKTNFDAHVDFNCTNGACSSL